MPKFNRNMLYLSVAILLGLAASFMAVHYVNKQVAARTHVSRRTTRTVVVPIHDLNRGATLTNGDVASRKVPVDFVPADALTPEDYGQFMGQVLRSPLAQGAPIPASAIERVVNHFSDVIQPQHVAYTIQVNETNSLSGLIVPGDHIDLLLRLSSGRSDSVRPLLSDVLVLATGRRAKGMRVGKNNSSYSNITLELLPRDAQRVGVAKKIGQLLVMLRRPGNDEAFHLGMLSKANLLRMGHGRYRGIQFIIGGSQ